MVSSGPDAAFDPAPFRPASEPLLARRAKIGGTPSNHDALDLAAAVHTFFAFPAVDKELVLHSSLLPSGVAIVID